MAALRVSVFGTLQMRNGEASVSAFPTRRVEELFGYLLLNQGARHPREKLVDTLWPDIALSNGRASLSTALWRLRGVFNKLGMPADEVLNSNRDWISFDPPLSVELDLAEFEQHLAVAEQLTGKMGQLMIAVEDYPDLKSDQTMIQAMQTYNEVEAQIAAARRFYNSAVTSLNSSVQIFPGNIIAGMVGVSEMPFYEADEASKASVNADDYLK